MFGNKKKKEKNSLLEGIGLGVANKVAPNKSICPSLSFKTRVYGWAICFCIGMLISFVSSGLLKNLVNGSMLKFAILYTAGTLTSLAASMFLWGPAAQCKAMFDKTRRWTTIIFLSCIVGVVVCCAVPTFKGQVPLIMALVFLQFLAYFWYSLSFIPYGRSIFCKCVKKNLEE